MGRRMRGVLPSVLCAVLAIVQPLAPEDARLVRLAIEERARRECWRRLGLRRG
jgi:hypothetical protein